MIDHGVRSIVHAEVKFNILDVMLNKVQELIFAYSSFHFKLWLIIVLYYAMFRGYIVQNHV